MLRAARAMSTDLSPRLIKARRRPLGLAVPAGLAAGELTALMVRPPGMMLGWGRLGEVALNGAADHRLLAGGKRTGAADQHGGHRPDDRLVHDVAHPEEESARTAEAGGDAAKALQEQEDR